MQINNLSYTSAIAALNDLVTNTPGNIDDCTLKLYFDWVSTQTQLFVKEKQDIVYDESLLPQTISSATYNYLKPSLKAIVDSGYNKQGAKYTRNTNTISDMDSTKLFKALFLVKRNIVWVDFGFNVGKEFGGRHPAVILKNLGEVLIVAPISTNTNGVTESNTVITLLPDDVYHMPSLRHRFTNITRITPVSLIRVDCTSPIGSMKKPKFNEIIDKIKNFYD